MSKTDWKPEIRLIMRFIISVVVLCVCCKIIFGRYPDDYVKVAFGFVGIVIGYWLK